MLPSLPSDLCPAAPYCHATPCKLFVNLSDTVSVTSCREHKIVAHFSWDGARQMPTALDCVCVGDLSNVLLISGPLLCLGGVLYHTHQTHDCKLISNARPWLT
jgi:hypothetical protein